MQSNKQVMGLGSAVVLVKETLLEESGVQKLRAQIQTKDARIKELEEVLETSSAERFRLKQNLDNARARATSFCSLSLTDCISASCFP